MQFPALMCMEGQVIEILSFIFSRVQNVFSGILYRHFFDATMYVVYLLAILDYQKRSCILYSPLSKANQSWLCTLRGTRHLVLQ